MTNYANIQAKIDKGLGIAGKHLGPPYTGYRITTGSGDFPVAWTALATNVLLYKERLATGKLDLPLSGSEAIWYALYGNMSNFLLGDVFLSTDPAFVPGVSYGAGATSIPGTVQFRGLALAWHPSAGIPIAGRLDRRVQIYRPASAPVALTDSSLYWKSTHDQDQPLQLNAGNFAFGTLGGVGSFVPCGFASMERPITSPLIKPPVPGMVFLMRYYGYLPYLPGYTPAEGDALVDEDGARYLVVHPYTQLTGVTGSCLLLERQVSTNN